MKGDDIWSESATCWTPDVSPTTHIGPFGLLTKRCVARLTNSRNNNALCFEFAKDAFGHCSGATTSHQVASRLAEVRQDSCQQKALKDRFSKFTDACFPGFDKWNCSFSGCIFSSIPQWCCKQEMNRRRIASDVLYLPASKYLFLPMTSKQHSRIHLDVRSNPVLEFT